MYRCFTLAETLKITAAVFAAASAIINLAASKNAVVTELSDGTDSTKPELMPRHHRVEERRRPGPQGVSDSHRNPAEAIGTTGSELNEGQAFRRVCSVFLRGRPNG